MTRVNLFYLLNWRYSKLVKDNQNSNFHKILFSITNQFILNKFIKIHLNNLFETSNSKQSLEELFRSNRVIKFSLNDYYLKGNFLQRSLKDLLEE